MAHRHARIVQHPFAASLQGGLLDAYEEDPCGEQASVVLNVRALERTVPSELFERDGSIHERLTGLYRPVRLRFSGVSGLKNGQFFQSLAGLPPDHSTRTINDFLSWRQAGRQDVFYLVSMHAPQADHLMFFAGKVMHERLSHEAIPATMERDWCPPPPMPHRLIPEPAALHRRYGGDPIRLHIGGRPHRRQLFIGGLDIQPGERPQVDVVLNLGEKPSRWVRDHRMASQDRWENKGEGADGMGMDDIREEAEWVITHLKKRRRVLVHCAAGMNRSATICCAVLLLLEGLTAEQALERVREHHPWARPDSRHWLKLRWLAITNSQ